MKLFLTEEDTAIIMESAQVRFHNKYIGLDTCDLFLPQIEKGTIQLEGQSQNIYVSTHYAYEDRLVNGNKTRYKIQLALINVKHDKYQIQYDSYGMCFVAYEDNGIKFIPYEDYNDFLSSFIRVVV